MISIKDMVTNMTNENPFFIRKGEFADLVATINIQRVTAKVKRNSKAIFQQPGQQDKKRLQASGALGEQGIINIQRRICDIFETIGEGNLIPSDVSVILSLPGCIRQQWHYDFNIIEKPVETIRSIFCIVAVQDNTSISVLNKLTGEVIIVKLRKGDAFFSRGDVIHSGDGYKKHNLRLHWFGDYPNNKRDYRKTYLYHEPTNTTTTSEHYAKYFAVRRKNIKNAHKSTERLKVISKSRAEFCRNMNKKSKA